MKNFLLLLILAILGFAPLQAKAATAYVVTEKTSDGLLIQDDYSNVWYVTIHYCPVYTGDVVIVDSSYGIHSYDEIIVPSSWGGDPDTCNISEAHEVTHKAKLIKDIDGDNAIILFSGDQYLVELGIGCSLSLWRYEGDEVYLDLGGSSLNGIGDTLILPDGDDCKIWDGEEISSGGGTYVPTYVPTPKVETYKDCPLNSYENPQDSTKCLCNVGYEINSAKTACVLKEPEYTCPINSHQNPQDATRCICNEGYEINDARDKCVIKPTEAITYECLGNSHTDPNDKTMCVCDYGFKINSDRSGCTRDLEQHDNVNTAIPVVPINDEKPELACPSNSYKEKGDCICVDGYGKSLNKQYCVKIPENAHYVESPTDIWLCNEGYVEEGNSCKFPVVEEEGKIMSTEAEVEEGEIVSTKAETEIGGGFWQRVKSWLK
jgi:hypothetical protein